MNILKKLIFSTFLPNFVDSKKNVMNEFFLLNSLFDQLCFILIVYLPPTSFA